MENPASRALGLIKKLLQEWRYGRKEQALTVASILLAALYSALESLLSPLAAPFQPWAGRVVLALAVAAFVWAVVRLWRRPVAPEPSDEPTRPSAIKGPSSFGPQDAALFARLGRDGELRTLKDWVLEPNVGLGAVMGESGVGKTSLLRAGMVRAAGDAFQVVYWEALPEKTVERLLNATSPLFDDGSSPQTLDQLALRLRDRRCVVVLDQFEQLSRERHPDVFEFLEEVAAQDPPFAYLIVVAFRREYAAEWREFELSLPPEAQGRLRTLPVRRLSLETARQAVAVLVEDAALNVDRSFLDRVLEDARGEDGTISPTEIGIALQVLGELSADQLASYRNLGGREQLLGIYLERVLDSFSESERTEVFRGLLRLVDIEADRRIAEGHSLEEIVEEAQPAHRLSYERNLTYLASDRARILERLKGDVGEIRYRLIHERLIPVLRRLTSGILAEVDQVSRLLDRKCRIWRQDRKGKFLLSWGEIRRVHRHRSQVITGSSAGEKERFFQRSIGRLRILQGTGAVLLLVLAIGAGWGWSEFKAFRYREQLRAWNLPSGLYDRRHQFEEIDLRQLPMTSLEWLGNASSLKTLKINGCPVGSLKGLPISVESLYISDTQVTSVGGLPPSLQLLDISGTRVESLEGLPPSVRSLDMRGTPITSLEGIPYSIHSLDISL